eukprot:15437513-Alexandrium_andersonii.AAC.1
MNDREPCEAPQSRQELPSTARGHQESPRITGEPAEAWSAFQTNLEASGGTKSLREASGACKKH